MLFWEDLEVGSSAAFGEYDVTRAEVITFAENFDPQPFHLDDEAAARTHFGRLSASGWHTCAMTMRMMVDHMKMAKQAGLGSPGVDNLKWLTPVYPDDTLRCETKILSKRRSKSKPELGLYQSRVRTFNQHDEMVLEMVSNAMIVVKDPDASII
ncbi:Itaconyl-CoA hydratase [Alteripontixanthobacter maritimus]|uniref:Itaconyl-CoA hydratase n=1 Tax=Alteripontixanthobacter maritimus TaxID=2161824 RepID=A0A369Q5Y2_9SPHN|nr:MaoC family dehydratase [Alteripontixanthobacter maritimus]RDC59892.1 Itaconyl-CoA hydratase [Alteripontixanthobacter maritimus]